MGDKEILEWLRAELAQGRRPGIKRLRAMFGIGEYRARRLLSQALGEVAGEQGDGSLPLSFVAKHRVDLDQYEIERFLVNEWGTEGAKSEQVKVWLRRKEPDYLAGLAEALSKYPKLKRVPPDEGGEVLALLSIFDLHAGMLAWHREVGENYDTEIAIERLKVAASTLLSKVPSGVSAIVIPVGNDILHADTHLNTTTSGTQVDVDGRWQRAFQHIVRALITGPLTWAAEIAPVHVVIVPGNHDYQRAFYLGEVLRWHFAGRNLPVEVDNSPRLRKYLLWQGILLGFTHGAWVKVDHLPSIMASEVPREWGEAVWREWVIGHFHAKREIRHLSFSEGGGVRVRVMPAMASEDAWHYQQGFVGRRPEATLTLYEAQRGPSAEFYYRP